MSLLQAIDAEDIQRIKQLLLLRTTNVNYTDNHNFAAIHHAVRKPICYLIFLIYVILG
jgi:hypothetical protein